MCSRTPIPVPRCPVRLPTRCAPLHRERQASGRTRRVGRGGGVGLREGSGGRSSRVECSRFSGCSRSSLLLLSCSGGGTQSGTREVPVPVDRVAELRTALALSEVPPWFVIDVDASLSLCAPVPLSVGRFALRVDHFDTDAAFIGLREHR